MPKFQLRIREPEREPRTIAIGAPIVIGRARGADVTVADKEAGRKQFRISVNADFVVLEGLGSTNPTRVDDRTIQAGEQTTVETGSVIRVGKTEFEVLATEQVGGPESGDARPQPEADLGMTMVGGFRPGAPAPPKPPANHDLEVTMAEGDKPAPGSAKPPAAAHQPPPANLDATMAGGFRPGAPPAPPPTQPTPPPAPPAPPPAPPTASHTADANVTMAGGFRPGAPSPPAPTSDGGAGELGQTIVRAPATGGASDDLSSWRPRMFVKGGGLKRVVELVKERSLIGRAEPADVLIPHESVSERHAEVCFDGQHWTLKDADSTNGTVIDGELVRGEARALRRNTLIAVGALRMVFLCNDRANAAADMRAEDRALHGLVRSRLLSKSDAKEIRACVRETVTTTVAEIVLRDTSVSATDWATALLAARKPRSLIKRLLGLIGLAKG